MRSRFCVRSLSGALALGASLALSIPGVYAARAEPSELISLEPTANPPAASCGVPSALEAERAALRTSAAMVRLQQRLEREMPDAGNDVIPLNTRGYGYHGGRYVGPPIQSREPQLNLVPEALPARRAP